uniref:Uncharacterized protein n=1 Tax=Anguilla anguilla TaxID=7936 RepID=A0A0E9SYK4_ANGAN
MSAEGRGRTGPVTCTAAGRCSAAAQPRTNRSVEGTRQYYQRLLSCAGAGTHRSVSTPVPQTA